MNKRKLKALERDYACACTFDLRDEILSQLTAIEQQRRQTLAKAGMLAEQIIPSM